MQLVWNEKPAGVTLPPNNSYPNSWPARVPLTYISSSISAIFLLCSFSVSFFMFLRPHIFDCVFFPHSCRCCSSLNHTLNSSLAVFPPCLFLDASHTLSSMYSSPFILFLFCSFLLLSSALSAPTLPPHHQLTWTCPLWPLTLTPSTWKLRSPLSSRGSLAPPRARRAT